MNAWKEGGRQTMVNAEVCEMEMRRLTDTFKKARAAELLIPVSS